MTRDEIADAWLAGGWHARVLDPVEKPSHDNVAWVRQNKPFTLSLAYRIADFVISLQGEDEARAAIAKAPSSAAGLVEQPCPKCAASRMPCDEHYRRDAAPIAAACIMPNCRNAAPAGDAFCSRHRNAVAMMDHKPSPKVTFDLAPPAIELPTAPVPSWADQRLAKAYALISTVSDEHSSEGDIWPLLRAALDAVENADCKMESGE